MPRLDLGTEDVTMLIDYIDRQNRALRDASGAAGKPMAAAAAVTAPAPAANLKPIVDPYLRIQLALNADSMRDTRSDAGRIAAEAGALGPRGAAIDAASQDFQKAGDLKAARTAFARLGDAIMAYAKATGAGIGDDVKVAYCPMVQKYWLQRGETIQNPYYGKKMSDCGRISATLPE
jgi:Cu(I)/Ag(I) efflux system membrane fusion protein